MASKRFLFRYVKLRHLRLMVAIDDARQLSKVARVMHISQPAVSKTLAEIEALVGSRLFERTPHGLLPTPAGMALIRSARDILAELERAGAELERLTRGQSRSLVIGAMPSASLSILAESLAQLRQDEPDLALKVCEGITEDLLAQLLAGRLDAVVGARFSAVLPEGLIAYPLYEDPMVFLAAPGHPATCCVDVTWADLAGYPWILTPPSHPLRAGFERTLIKHGMDVPRQVIDSSMMDLALGLVASGKAITLSALRQANYWESLGLARIIGTDHWKKLSLTIKVSLFTQKCEAHRPEIQSLLNCLERTLVASSQQL